MRIFSLSIIDFFYEVSDRVLYRYDLVDRESGELMTYRLRFLFLELPNCSRALTPEATPLDDFCYYLRNKLDMSLVSEGEPSELS